MQIPNINHFSFPTSVGVSCKFPISIIFPCQHQWEYHANSQYQSFFLANISGNNMQIPNINHFSLPTSVGITCKFPISIIFHCQHQWEYHTNSQYQSFFHANISGNIMQIPNINHFFLPTSVGISCKFPISIIIPCQHLWE